MRTPFFSALLSALGLHVVGLAVEQGRGEAELEGVALQHAP